MKRSEINLLIDKGISFLKKNNYPLPPQAFWSLEEWNENKSNSAELRKRGCGWDLTDFGSGNYKSIGLLLYTLSNGVIDLQGRQADQNYANKLLIVSEDQVTPMHHHWSKMEDIINKGGGILCIQLFKVGENDSVDKESEFEALIDNVRKKIKAGTVIELQPGSRIRLEQGHYHKFWGKKGKGTILVEEVSMVNDDSKDNCFLPEDKVGRFPEIAEDAKPKYLLCTELPGTGKFEELLKKHLKAK